MAANRIEEEIALTVSNWIHVLGIVKGEKVLYEKLRFGFKNLAINKSSWLLKLSEFVSFSGIV